MAAMERVEIGGDVRLAALVDAVARGEEVVFARDGEPVAELRAVPERKRGSLNRDALMELREKLAPLRMSDPASLIRAMRDDEEI
jgi:antitoxin (DNA-binding transcriptional repressor) of toxin-antitoxin stability system